MTDTESSEKSSQSLLSNPLKVSVVWDYFGFENKQEGHHYHYRRIKADLLRQSQECM